MVTISDDRRRINWSVIKVLRKKSENNMTSAIQIRQGLTDVGNLTFSYVFGVFVEDEQSNNGEKWVPYMFIPDRYALDYLDLFQLAVDRVRGAMRDAERNADGMVTPEALQVAVIREIRRKR